MTIAWISGDRCRKRDVDSLLEVKYMHSEDNDRKDFRKHMTSLKQTINGSIDEIDIHLRFLLRLYASRFNPPAYIWERIKKLLEEEFRRDSN
jgi:hypothetical protein